ncbi:MAG: DUF3137 domain-containing protein [Alphaproteobacteria bacterium]|nr:DUF3137 domain-containing protein [Alphaproteobacteria bacterium]
MKNINHELAQTHIAFKDFYEQNLRKIYEKLEPERKKFLRSFIIRFIFYVIGVSFFLLLCAFGIIDKELLTSKGFMKLTLAIYGGWGIYVFMPFSNYRAATKSRVMNILLSFWGNARYRSHASYISDQDISSSELFTCYNRCETDDSFYGFHKNVEMSVAEQVIKMEGNRGDTNIFKGALILLEFNKKFQGKTVVKSKYRALNILWNNPLFILAVMVPVCLVLVIPFMMHDFIFSLICLFMMLGMFTVAFGLIYLTYRRKRPRKATQCVLLEGLAFMKKWKVYTDDQIAARVILTPVLMENIVKVCKLFHGKNVDFSFFSNKLLIAVHTRTNLFETTSLFLPALHYGKVREVVNQLHSIFSVIDVLNIKDTKDVKTPTKSKKTEKF